MFISKISKLFFNIEFFFSYSLIFILTNILYSKIVKIFFKFKFLFSNKIILVFSILQLILSSVLLLKLFDKRYFMFFSNFLNNDLILFSKILICFLSIPISISLNNYIKSEKIYKNFEFHFVFLLAIFSMFLSVSSSELMFLYISFEMLALILYILSSSKQISIFSVESGLKYFLLGAISSGFLLIGSSFIYSITGSTKFFEINLFLNYGFDLITIINFSFSFLFFIIPFFFKFSIAPFHVWTPDVYEGSPTIATFFFLLSRKLSFSF